MPQTVAVGGGAGEALARSEAPARSDLARSDEAWHGIAMIIVVMGPSGSGKTVIGQALASRLGVPFLEGDSLHPAANVAKMHAGHALNDADRAPWLDAVADWIARHADGVIPCSALKRAYRDRLRAADARLCCVLLETDPATLAARVEGRAGHFMPASLLGDQLRTLEPIGIDEAGFAVANIGSVDMVAAAILRKLAHARV